jgi:hypothetical protein
LHSKRATADREHWGLDGGGWNKKRNVRRGGARRMERRPTDRQMYEYGILAIMCKSKKSGRWTKRTSFGDCKRWNNTEKPRGRPGRV